MVLQSLMMLLEKQVLVEGEADPVNIIGVVKNWHQRGLGNAFTPVMFVLNGRIGWITPKFIAIKTTSPIRNNVKFNSKNLGQLFPRSEF